MMVSEIKKREYNNNKRGGNTTTKKRENNNKTKKIVTHYWEITSPDASPWGKWGEKSSHNSSLGPTYLFHQNIGQVLA